MSHTNFSNEVLRNKIRVARGAAGFTLSDAARHLEFNNYQTLSAIEKGNRNITAHELSAMASLYGRTLEYFFESENQPEPVPLWRKVCDAPVKPIERKFLSFLENYSNLENLYGLKRKWKAVLKSYDKSDFAEDGFRLAEKLGTEMSNALGLGVRPSSNLLNVLENDLRIKILHLPLENGVSGASVLGNRLGAGILINASDAPWRRNFDLAHELFHIITWDVFSHHEVGDGTVKTRPEQYANAFASSLLLPKTALQGTLEEISNDSQIRMSDVIQLAKEFGVSTEAILWRLVNVNVLKRQKAEEIISSPEIRKMDKLLRKGLYFKNKPEMFSPRYIYLAYKALSDGKISRGVFAEYMAIDRFEVDEYLKKQGFLESNYAKIASA
ncbi:MAG: ImmA/IrrE family metallo-endopeptidase [Deltaproteobacteria bacterium]|nr:ImmA/IrrE family metallo-endopeptidase [Deltaproteobacteria bacterium]